MVDAVPTGDGFTQWIIAAGMSIGAGIAGVIIRGAWRPEPRATREISISGQAQITDLGPIRDLVKQVDALAPRLQAVALVLEKGAQQQERTATSIEGLALIVKDYIQAQQTERDNEDEVERRVAERVASINTDEVRRQIRAVNARASRARKPTQRKPSGTE